MSAIRKKETPRSGLLFGSAAAVFFLLFGCASQHSSTFLEKKAALAREFAFDTAVFIDQARDPDVGWQVGEYAALLEKRNRSSRLVSPFPVYDSEEPALFLPALLKITQRSYVDRLSVKTSIYGELCVRDPEKNKILLMTTYYYLGSDTILSAKMQKKVVKKLISRAFSAQKWAKR